MDINKEFITKLNDITVAERNKYKAELKQLQEKLMSTVGHLENMKIQNAKEKEELSKEKEELSKEKEELKKKTNTPVRDLVMEANLRKMRDDCIEALRKNKIELNELKQENLVIKREANNLEKQLQEKEASIKQISGSSVSLKENYIQTLNNQKTEWDKKVKEKERVIGEKSARITELESMLSDAVRKLTDT